MEEKIIVEKKKKEIKILVDRKKKELIIEWEKDIQKMFESILVELGHKRERNNWKEYGTYEYLMRDDNTKSLLSFVGYYKIGMFYILDSRNNYLVEKGDNGIYINIFPLRIIPDNNLVIIKNLSDIDLSIDPKIVAFVLSKVLIDSIKKKVLVNNKDFVKAKIIFEI